MTKGTAKKSIFSMLVAGALMFSASALAVTPGDDDPGTDPDPGGDNGGDTGGGYTRGPDPTQSSVQARSGPYSVSTENVRRASGFGGGTIHYPTDASGTMAAIVVVPGFVSPEASIQWWGPKLASHGFVVMTIDTNSGFDQPGSRARQLNSALDHLLQANSVSGMIDSDRLAVMGWSMGGGGALRVATEGRVSAAIGMAPWDTGESRFRNIDVPTMIFACENDAIAAVRSHAQPFYTSIPDSTDKAFVELSGGSHNCGNGGNRYNETLSQFGVSWMKLHLDDDSRYEQFVCGSNAESGRQIERYASTCPF